MGYESRFYAIRKYSVGADKDKYYPCEIIAMLNMCKMGAGEFLDLFDTEAMINLWLPGFDEDGNEIMTEQHEDKYGDPIKYITDIDEGIRMVHGLIAEDNYWRFELLLQFLEMFKDKEDVLICHYGY